MMQMTLDRDDRLRNEFSFFFFWPHPALTGIFLRPPTPQSTRPRFRSSNDDYSPELLVEGRSDRTLSVLLDLILARPLNLLLSPSFRSSRVSRSSAEPAGLGMENCVGECDRALSTVSVLLVPLVVKEGAVSVERKLTSECDLRGL